MFKRKHAMMLLVFITLAIITIILCIKCKCDTTDGKIEKYTDNVKDITAFLLKYYNLSLSEAEKLLPRVKQGEYPSYFDIKHTNTPILIKNSLGKEYIIPPLNAQLMRDPRDKVQKPSKKLKPMNMFNKETYIPNIPTPTLPRTDFSLDLNEVIRARLERSRIRDYITSPVLTSICVIDDEEPDVWSEGARGILVDSVNKKLYMCNKGTINKFSVSNNLGFNISMIENPTSTSRPQCQYNNAYGYGQPTKIKLEFGRINGINNFIVAPVICNNGRSKLEFFSPTITTLNQLKTLQLPNGLNPKWIAHDSITNYTLIPSSDNLSSIGVYNIYLLANGVDLTIQKIMDLPIVGNDRLPITLESITAGCFSDDGVLYLLSNSETNNGFMRVFWTNDNKLLVKDGYTNFADDQLVGITSFNKDILVLVRNNDFGDDNISIFRIIEQLPDEFSWNNPAQVLLHKNMNFQLSDVLMQEACGSCWAFASSSMLADRYGIIESARKAKNLSVTYILSCSDFEYHCDGGSTNWSRNYLIDHGTTTETCWDYKWCKTSLICANNSYTANFETDFTDEIMESIAPTCQNKRKCITCDNSTNTKVCTDVIDPRTGRPMIAKLYKGLEQSHVWFDNFDDIKNDIFLNGPVCASFIVYNDFVLNTNNFRETGGVYIHDGATNYYGINDFDEQRGSHAVTIVGWGLTRGIRDTRYTSGTYDRPYWIIKNSWSTAWADLGYCKVAMTDRERNINVDIHLDTPATYGLGWLGVSVAGASSILPNPDCPCSSA